MAKQTYKNKLLSVSALKTSGLTGLHQRMRLLVDVFEDASFREDIGGDDYEIANALDKYVDDCVLTFLELRTVLQAFPSEADWQKANLRQLLADATAKGAASKLEGGEKPPRRTVTIKEYDRLSEQLKDAQHSSKTLTDEVSELRAENRRLLAENAKLEGRIVEMERAIERYSGERHAVSAR